MKQYAYLRMWYKSETWEEAGLLYTTLQYARILKPYVKISKVTSEWDDFENCFKMQADLGVLGALGWELVSVTRDESNDIDILYFKKELIETLDNKSI